MVGPILGPMLGGWLTDVYDWRWVFYINVPVGILTFLGLGAYLERNEPQRGLYFDWFGFLSLSIAIGALQMMLDRGEQLEWFDSPEIVMEAACALLGGYLFLVHSFTAERPFLDFRIFRDRNFFTGIVFIFVVGVILLATLALLTPFLQLMLGYPVFAAGVLLAPRGIGTMIAMMAVGKLVNRVDPRWLVAAGLALTALALWQMSGFTLEVSRSLIVWSGILQGLGLGFIFVPLSTMTFATLAPELRTQATALFSLSRNLGSSIGISIFIYLLGQHINIAHANLSEFIAPFRAPVQHLPAMLDPATTSGRALLDATVMQQAGLLGYLWDFRLMMYVALVTLPFVPLMRRPVHHPRTGDEEDEALEHAAAAFD
jgi:DHA2 family multidrug resistance protein